MPDLDDIHAAPAVFFDSPGAPAPRLLALAGTRLTSDQARLARLVGSGCRSALAGLGQDAGLLLQPADQALACDWSDPVSITGRFGVLEFADGARLLRAITGIDIGGERGAGDERWQWLQAALIGRLKGTPLAGAVRIAFAAGDGAAAPTVLRFTLETGQHAFSTVARGSALAWLGLLGEPGWLRERRPAAAFAGLSVQISVRIARHTMPAHLVATLHAGDIIVPCSPNFTCNGEGSIGWGGLTARVCYRAPGALTIIALEGNVAQTEHDEHDEQIGDMAAGGADRGPVLDQVVLTLDFELGKVSMTLGQLRSIAVGSVVLLDGGSPAALAIVAGGRTLGHGEAVDVDGRLGIRVTQWEQGQ